MIPQYEFGSIREILKKIAKNQLDILDTDYSFKNYKLVRVNRKVMNSHGVAFEQGEITIGVEPDRWLFDGEVRVWSFKTKSHMALTFGWEFLE